MPETGTATEAGAFEVEADLPITIHVNTQELLHAFTRRGYDPQTDEEFGSNPLSEVLLDKVAALVATKVMTEVFRGKIEARVTAVVDEAVREALDGEFQPYNQYGEAEGAPTSMREMIAKKIAEWPTAVPDRYYSNTPNFAAWLTGEVSKQVTADLGEVLTPLREQVKQFYKDQSAELLASVMAGENPGRRR
jgi:hypothetical protein